MADKYVYDFQEGNKDMKYLLGGKGANLAEMTNMGLPVPLGFTVTCEACNAYRSAGRQFPDGMLEEVAGHLEQLEEGMGRRLGDPGDPLLVSVRSGAPFSMPGMMDTVLNLGLNDQSVEGLTKQTGSERFAWDSYRRLLQMYGKTVMGVDGDRFEEALEHAKEAKGVRNDVELDEGDLKTLVEEFKGIIASETGEEFPQDPRAQLTGGIEAVFGSWDNKRAIDYRRKNKIDDSLGTAVNIQAMVFGNKGDDSGTGVAFTRNPANGEPAPYGDYLVNAQGEDVVAGIRNTMKLEEMGDVQPQAWEELQGHMQTLERHYRDMCDIEFTVEQGKLWLLQTRIGKRTAFAEWTMAHDMLADDMIDVDTALLRLDANRLEELFKKVIAAGGGATAIASGLNASPGAAVGKARVQRRRRPGMGRAGRAGDPGPPRDHPRRLPRHDPVGGHPDLGRRDQQPRRRGRPGRGHPGRVRGRPGPGRPPGQEVHRRRHRGGRGRLHHHRRLHRQGVRRPARAGRLADRAGPRRRRRGPHREDLAGL